jgi:hypothetical protein
VLIGEFVFVVCCEEIGEMIADRRAGDAPVRTGDGFLAITASRSITAWTPSPPAQNQPEIA